MSWAGQKSGIVGEEEGEDGICLFLISIWRYGEPLAICQAALLSI